MDYRDKFYEKYITTQTSNIYGGLNLGDIKKQFPIFKSYFGKFLPKNKEVKIIDLGCGNGDLILWLQNLGFKDVAGIDYSKEQVEFAKKLGVKNILQGDLKEFLKNKKEVFDVIFMRDVLEHFNKEEILEVMELVYSALSKNGAVVIHTPNGESIFSGRYRFWDFTHEMSFTKTSLRQLFGVSGFEKIEFYSSGPVVHGLKSLIRYLLWKIIEFILKIYLLVETGSGEGIFTQNLIAVAQKM